MAGYLDGFRIQGFEADDRTGEVSFHYAFRSGPSFTETVAFGRALPAPGSPARHSLDAALESLSVLLGVSYYKAFAPRDIAVESPRLSAEQVAFFRDLYLNGLGEFAYRNEIDLSDRLRFSGAEAPDGDKRVRAAEPTVGPHACPAVLVGGGKDSLVSIEMLRSAGIPLTLFAVNPKKPILDCAAASGYPLVSVLRHIDSRLFELNDAGAFNGHVPITAIVSFIAVAAAFIHDFDAVILSNERSADEATLEDRGNPINHQFSKTSLAETAIADYVAAYIAPDLGYFSLLRPLSEFHIAHLFARADRYDGVFTSCNRAFRLRAAAPTERWCCDCPKCRFTFLMLAVAMPPARLLGIFGANLLDDPTQRPGYEALAGLSGHKPWECVGEVAESRAGIAILSARPEWRGSAVIAALTPLVAALPDDLDAVAADLMTPSPDHALPPRYQSALDAYAV